MPHSAAAFVFAVTLCVASTTVAEERNWLLNPGAEQVVEDQPTEWQMARISAPGLKFSRSINHSKSGSASLAISNTHVYDRLTCNNWHQIVRDVPSGKSMRIGAYIKTEGAENANVCVQCLSDPPSPIMLAFSSTPVVKGDQDWKWMESEAFVVPPGTKLMVVRAALCGLGAVWFDQLTLSESPTSPTKPDQSKQGLERLTGGHIRATMPIDKDAMVLGYMPTWNHGEVDNLAVANTQGGVRTLIHWPLPSAEVLASPKTRFWLAVYARQAKAQQPIVQWQVHEITKDWPERTAWEQQPTIATLPITTTPMTAGEGWKVVDVTKLVRQQAAAPQTNHGVLLKFDREDVPAPSLSTYHFVSREGLGEWQAFRPVLLVVEPSSP